MKSRITSIAEAELSEATAFYENAAEGIGGVFIESVAIGILKIESTPNLGRPTTGSCLKFAILTFPYDIVYEVLPHEIVVHAFAHQSRRPEYWLDRL